MSKLTKKQVVELSIEAQNIMTVVEDYKKLYARLDEITALLVGADLFATGIVVVDNFQDKNVVFRPAAVRRFELKRVA